MVIGALVTQLRRASEVLGRPYMNFRFFADGSGSIVDHGNVELADFENWNEASDILEDAIAGRLTLPQPKIKGGQLVTQA